MKKYKQLDINLKITVRGIANKETTPKLLYHFDGNPTLDTVEKLIGYIKEWYPMNKKKAIK